MGQPKETENALVISLRKAGVLRAAIIDDTFDPPGPGSVIDSDLDQFRAELRADPALAAVLSSLDTGIQPTTDLNAGHLRTLWELRGREDPLGETIRSLFAPRLQQLADLHAVKAQLEGVGLEVVTIGKTQGEADLADVQIAFLDYYLGDPADLDAVKDSAARAKAIAERQIVLILMSSLATVHEADAEKFRDDSGLVQGLFRFIPKHTLTEPASLQAHLATLSLDVKNRFAVQTFVNDAQKALKVAADQAGHRLRAISFEDYGFVQRLSLRTDGQPLGEYMLWLLEETLNQMVRREGPLQAAVETLDRLSFEGDLLMPAEGATRQIAEFYTAAVCHQPIEDLKAHPLAPREGIPADALYAQFGDLLFDEGGINVAVVLAASCDLAFSTARPFQPERTVLLMPGRLEPLDKPVGQSDNSFLTELFLTESSEVRRIEWLASRAELVAHGTLLAWCQAKGLRRKARLKPQFAFHLQHAYAARLTRVGLPAIPPMPDAADVEILTYDGTVAATIRAGAFFTGAATKDRGCILTSKTLKALLDLLTTTAAEAGEGEVAGRRAKAQAILDSARWMSVMKRLLPKNKVSQISTDLTEVGMYSGAEKPQVVKQFMAVLWVRPTSAEELEVEDLPSDLTQPPAPPPA